MNLNVKAEISTQNNNNKRLKLTNNQMENYSFFLGEENSASY